MSRSKYSSALPFDSLVWTPIGPSLTIIQLWPYGPLWMVNGTLINSTNGIFDGWGQ
jgi:hypothetical protein